MLTGGFIMAGPENAGFSASAKSAVVVIDNQFGLLEGAITPDAADAVWKQVTQGLLSKHYDEVIIVTGHHPDGKDNPIIAALQQATSRFGKVDMFTMMHTNMVPPGEFESTERSIAQIPFWNWRWALNSDQRSHLRFLYSMGCDDGNEVAAIEALELGFKTYVGHQGTAKNVIATFPLFTRWMGDGQSIQAAADETNAEMNRCLPQIGEVLQNYREKISSTLKTFLECNQKAGGNKEDITLNNGDVLKANKRRNNNAVAACVSAAVPNLIPVVLDTARTAAICIPSASAAFGHITDPFSTAMGLIEPSNAVLAEFVDANAETIAYQVLPHNFKTDLADDAESMRLVVYGQDIHFEDDPKPGKPLTRREEITKLATLIMRSFQTGSGTLAAEAAFNRLLELMAIPPFDIAPEKDIPLLVQYGISKAKAVVNWLTDHGIINQSDFGNMEDIFMSLVRNADIAYLRKMIVGNGSKEIERASSSEKMCEILYALGDAAFLYEAFCRDETPPDVRLTIAKVFIKNRKFKKIKATLKRMLHDEKTPPETRMEIADIFVDNREFKTIKGLGRLFEERGPSGIDMGIIWGQAQKDPAFAKDLSDEITALMSNDTGWGTYHIDINFEIAESAPELLLMAAKKAASRQAANSDTWNGDREFVLFATTLLFERGKITEVDAKALLTQAKISAKIAVAMAESITSNFNERPILQKIFKTAL